MSSQVKLFLTVVLKLWRRPMITDISASSIHGNQRLIYSLLLVTDENVFLHIMIDRSIFVQAQPNILYITLYIEMR